MLPVGQNCNTYWIREAYVESTVDLIQVFMH